MTAGAGPDGPPRRALFETAFIYLLNAAFAVFTTIAGAALLPLTGEFGLDLAQGSRFVSFQNGGCFLGILAVGVVVDRFSGRALIFVCYCAFAAAIIAVRASSSMAAFLVLLLIAGFFTKIVDALLNATTSSLHPKNTGFYLNLLHSFYGMGSLLGPIYAGVVLERTGGDWRLAYSALGCLCLALALCYGAVFLRGRRGEPAARTRPAPEPVPGLRAVVDRSTLLCMGVLFLYCGHQMGMNNWYPAFMAETLGSDTMTAGFGLSSFWLGLIAGRLACSVLTRRIGERDLICAGNALGGGLLLLSLLVGGEAGAFGGAVLAGFLAGATIPLVITLGYALHPGAQGKISMLLFIAITLGGIAGPWLMGLAVSAAGLGSSFVLNAGMLFAAAALARFLPAPKQKRRQQ